MRADCIPGALSILKGAVPDQARGLGHMAPTYFVGSRGRYPTVFAARTLYAKLGFMLILPKSDLRRLAMERRADIGAAEAEKAALAIVEPALALVKAAFPQSAVVAAYWPMRQEISTLPLMERLHAEGYQVALPVPGLKATAMVFRAWSPKAVLRAGLFGVLHPDPSAAELQPSFVFAPVAAFDALGSRIGYGGGYYDATLNALRKKGRTVACGLAYGVQEVPKIGAEPHDQKLEFILTEKACLRF